MAEGSERENGGGMAKMDSTETRWIFQNEEDSEDVGDQSSFDSEEEDNGEQRLIRTGPRIDSFDVEALEVPGAQRHDYEDFSLGRSIILVLQTLGVVFGDVGTSPLYTFDIMFNKYPISKKEDVLGALSLVLYTLIMITLVKYTLIVLWGNDDGEGGIFALYSLICRNAKASLLPNQLPSDARISSFRLKVPSAELERSLKLKERLEASVLLKKLLLVLVLFGTSMVIAGGVVTPTMSVMSAVNGLKLGITTVEQGEVVIITVTSLVILFSVQKFGTSKMGLAVGPALFIWFCCLGGIGVYNLFKYGMTAFKAFNPVYIYCYFKKDPTQAWMSLGGCLLCATGSEAMFADLCYFSVRSVQLTFIFLVLPCLLLGYLGQAAFLMENPTQNEQVFFSSIPSGVFWPVVFVAVIAALIASRAMTTATFSCIKQATALGCFPRLKIIHTSRKFMGQIYIPVINWFLLVFCLGFVATFGSINEIGNAYGIAELGVMMMTTVLVTIIMLLIWQINIFLVSCFLIFFLGLELVFFSSVLGGVGDGSWVLLVFAGVLFMIMYIWNYGSKLRYETEVKQKLSMDLMTKLGCNLGTIRAPGIGLVYNELVKGIPAIFGHFLTTLPAIHSMIIFVCIKYVPVPVVPQNERFLFRRVCPKSYHMFRCIARYGYKDAPKERHQTFEQLLIESLEKFIRREAQERSLESDGDGDSDSEEEESCSRILVAPNGSFYSLGVPLLADYHCLEKPSFEASTSFAGAQDDAGKSLESELSFIHKAKESGVVYLLGHGDIRARKDSWFFKKLVINYFYAFLRKNCRRGIATLSVPHTNLMQPAGTDALNRLKCTSNLEDLRHADVIIEAIIESEDVKKILFSELDKLAKPSAILASNTSSISITRLASATSRPKQVIGMHFMNPPPVMKLIEIVRGADTSDEVFSRIKALSERFGKIVICSQDYPGFIVNRILMPMINEAFYALYTGVATKEDIDTGMKLGTNHPMGPLELADFIGLDVCLSIMKVLHQGLGDSKYNPCPLLVQYVDAGRLGRKKGIGIYSYKKELASAKRVSSL